MRQLVALTKKWAPPCGDCGFHQQNLDLTKESWDLWLTLRSIKLQLNIEQNPGIHWENQL